MSWEKAQKTTELLFGLIRIFSLLFKFALSIYVSHEINHKNLEKLNQSIKQTICNILSVINRYQLVTFHFHNLSFSYDQSSWDVFKVTIFRGSKEPFAKDKGEPEAGDQ
jgi:hypothetical protein